MKKRGRPSDYTDETIFEALKLVYDKGLSPYKASLKMNIPESTINNWVTGACRKDLVNGYLNDNGKPEIRTEDEMLGLCRECQSLREKLSRTKRENDELRQIVKGLAVLID